MCGPPAHLVDALEAACKAVREAQAAALVTTAEAGDNPEGGGGAASTTSTAAAAATPNTAPEAAR